MMRRRLPTLALGLSLLASGAAAMTAPPAPDRDVDPGGGAIPLAPPAASDPTADVATWAPPGDGQPARAADATSADPVARGRYLVDVGDCETCHTAQGGRPFAGARPIGTPFGIVYSSNLTPDSKTGIGAWSAEDFYRAMHKGVARGGKRLYPAFPYPYFTHLTRDDVDSIRAYLATVPAVEQATPANELPFPLNIRFLLRLWNALFFHAGTFRPDPARSEEWNRGAYLIWGPGHCGACHTPKNFLGADRNKHALEGGRLDDWVAVNLTGDPRQGLAGWSKADLVEYLRSGRNAHAAASGSMGEVIYFSTSRMSDADLAAMAAYLKDLPAGAPRTALKPAPGDSMGAGEAIFADNCAACHQASGEGVPRLFPPLKGDASLQAKDPTTIVRIILEGSRSIPTPAKPTPLAMPAFAWKLDDAEIASVATYARNAWGNAAPAVATSKVAKLRRKHGAPAG